VIVADPAELDGLDAVWAELWARTRPVPPMLEWSWVRTWWDEHAAEGQLLVILVHGADGRPLGLAPLYVRDEGLNVLKDPRRCLRTVHFLGTGEREQDEVTGEYTSWLAAPEDMDRVTDEVAAALARCRGDWDRLRLERMSPQSGIVDRLGTRLRDEAQHVERAAVPAFRLPVQPLEAYLAALPSANFRHRCRRALRAGREAGVELVRAANLDQAQEMFGALHSLHQQRWEGRGKPGVFSSALFTRFQQRMLTRYFQGSDGGTPERCWLIGLRQGTGSGGRWLAVRYLLRAGDALYDYLSGVDTATEAALAPGLLLHLMTIDACASAGIGVYDLMAGDYDYKRKLARQVDALPTLDLFARTMRSRLWLAARDIGRQLRAGRRESPRPPAGAAGPSGSATPEAGAGAGPSDPAAGPSPQPAAAEP
jgi:CelD/BcsL family acetyltransferase involved in cellulose biosynthesis